MTVAPSLISRTLEALAAPGSSYIQRAPAGESVDLSTGEARFDTPTAVRTLCATVIGQLPRIGYSDPQGEPDVRQAYRSHLALLSPRDGAGLQAESSEVMVTAGGKEAAWLAIGYTLQDRKVTSALLPMPGWEPYGIWARAFGCARVWYDPAALAAHPDRLRELVDRAPARPGLLVLNYPNNPTGVSVRQDRLDIIAELAAELDMAIVSDEVYRAFDPQSPSIAFCPSFDPERDLVVDSVSKWLGMAGLRVGFLLGGARPLRDILRFRATYASCTSLVTQQLAAALLRDEAANAWLGETRAEVARLRDAVAVELTARGVSVASGGSLYLWCEKPDPAQLPAATGAQPARITPGLGFGAPGYVRLCVARAGLNPAQAADCVVATLQST